MADHLLTQFFKALRGNDVRVSTSEAIDAMETVDLLGYGDRTQLKTALAMVLAKSEPEKSAFDLCFDQFFTFNAFKQQAEDMEANPPNADDMEMSSMPPMQGQGAQGGGGGPSEPSMPQGNMPQSQLGQLLLENDQTEMQMAIAQAGNQAGVSGITTLTQKGLYGRRIMEQMGLHEMEEEMWELERSEQAEELLTSLIAKAQLVKGFRDVQPHFRCLGASAITTTARARRIVCCR